MGKDYGWKSAQFALLSLVVCVGLHSGAVLAKTVVNPGNAKQLGPVERSESQPATAAPAPAAESGELTDTDLEALDSVAPTPAMPESTRATEEELEGDASLAHAAGCGCDDCTCSAEASRRAIKDYEFHGPMGVVGQHPPSVLFYQPVPDVATVLQDGSTVSTKLDWMNLIIRELDSGVVVDYDYEELRTTFDYRRALGPGELQVVLPVYHRGPGVLDNVIEGWHKLFGMNNGLRDTYPEGEFSYTIISRDGLVYNGVGDTAGIGDLSLVYKQPISGRPGSKSASAWRVGIKAPTGNSGDALGSGNWDYSAGLLYQQQIGQRLRAYANLDYVITGEPDWQNVDKHNVLHTLWAAEYAWTPRFSLLAQYSTADNPLRIGSFEADKNPRELTIGFNHRLSDKLLWTGGFREDLSPETAPDLSFNCHFKWTF